MHEAGIASNILEIAINETIKQGANSITKVYVRIGKMNALDSSSLTFAFDVLKENTQAHKAELIIDEIPVTVECHQCKKSYKADGFEIICPFCNSPDTTIIAGNELNIVELEVE